MPVIQTRIELKTKTKIKIFLVTKKYTPMNHFDDPEVKFEVILVKSYARNEADNAHKTCCLDPKLYFYK